MTDDYTLTLAVFDSGDARDKLRDATRIVLGLEDAYGKAVETAAEAEAFYRSEMARQFKSLRDAGAAVEAARIEAHGATAVQKKATLEASGQLKLAGEKLENARDTRRSLWRLVEWARDRDLATLKAGQQSFDDERVPANSWPR